MTVTEELNRLFHSTREKDEFEYVCTLINYKGMGYANDTTNLYEWFQLIEYYKSIYQSESTTENKVRIGLELYAHFFESSDLYNIIGSLTRIHLGYRASSYLYYKHNGKDKWLETGIKIALLKELLEEIEFSPIAAFFEKNYCKELRNSFIHSAYSIINEETYQINDGDYITIDGVGMSYVGIDEFVLPKIEAVIDFFNSFKLIYESEYLSYTENKVVMGRFPEVQPIQILGSNNGLLGYSASGAYVMIDGSGMWSALNVRFNFQSAETQFIKDEVDRFDKKNGAFKNNDQSLNNLIELIQGRGDQNELQDLSIIMAQGGDYLRDMGREEGNNYKKKDLFERSIKKYDESVDLTKYYPGIQNRAITKILLSRLTGTEKEVLPISYDEIFECWSETNSIELAKNLAVTLLDMKNIGIDIEENKTQLLTELESFKTEEYLHMSKEIALI